MRRKITIVLFIILSFFGCKKEVSSSQDENLNINQEMNKVEVYEYEGVEYMLEDNEYIAVSYTENINKEVIIPEEINNIKVTAIGKNCFRECETIEKIVLPNTITKLEDYCFADCYNLNDVVLSDNIKEIGMYALTNYLNFNKKDNINYIKSHSNDYFLLHSLETKEVNKINISDQTKGLYWNSISEIPTITELTIPSSVEFMGSRAISNCISLRNVKISENLKSIESFMFSGCYGLTEVTLPKSIEKIKTGAFNDCIALEKVNFESNIKHIDGDSFLNCKDFNFNIEDDLVYLGSNDNPYYAVIKSLFEKEKYSINENTKVIAANTFRGNKIIQEIELPKNLEYINSYAFSGCENLKNINLKNVKIKEIGDYVFYNCKSLLTLDLSDTITFIGVSCFRKCSALKEVFLSENIEFLSPYLFSECDNLEKVNLNKKIVKIGNYAFNMCHHLKSVSLPSSLLSVGQGSFKECYILENIVLSEGIEYIGAFCFYSNRRITGIVIPKSTKYIGRQSFSGVEGTVELDENNPYFYLEDGVLYSKNQKELIAPINHRGTKITIKEGIKEIRPYAFYNTKYYTIQIPSSIEKIGNYAFAGCDNLKKIELPETLKELSKGLFLYTPIENITLPKSLKIMKEYCLSSTRLSSIEIPNSVENIGKKAFSDNEVLFSVSLPSSLKVIKEETFSYCEKLKYVFLPSSLERIEENAFLACVDLNYKIKDEIKYLGTEDNPYLAMMSTANEFYGESIIISEETRVIYDSFGFIFNKEIKKLQLSNNIKRIPQFCFYYSKLLEIILPNNLVIIDDYGLAGCKSLSTIVIPKSVEYIGAYAFYDIEDLSIYLESETIGENWNEEWNYENRPVYLKGEWEYVNGIPTKK